MTEQTGTRSSDEGIPLTERELAIARRAANIAIQELTQEFYSQIGKTVVQKIFIGIGLMALGFAVARGWIKFGG